MGHPLLLKRKGKRQKVTTEVPTKASVYARRLNVLLEASDIHGDVAEE